MGGGELWTLDFGTWVFWTGEDGGVRVVWVV